MKEIIEGFVARDANGFIYLWEECPRRCSDIRYKWWESTFSTRMELPAQSFPDITWEDEPKKVKVTIDLEEEQ